MNRRTVLRSAAPGIGALSGCISGLTSNAGAEEFVELTVVEATSKRAETSLSADVTEQASADGPARLSVTFRNDGPERRFQFGASPPFSEYGSELHEDARLIAVPDTREYVRTKQVENVAALIPDEPTDSFYRANGILIRLDIALVETLSTGDRLTEEYTLLGWHQNQTRLPEGHYEFKPPHQTVILGVT